MQVFPFAHQEFDVTFSLSSPIWMVVEHLQRQPELLSKRQASTLLAKAMAYSQRFTLTKL